MNKKIFTWGEFDKAMEILAEKMLKSKKKSIYGIPRGGSYIAYSLSKLLSIPIVDFERISQSTFIVDDIVDSGATRRKYSNNMFGSIHARSYIPPDVLQNLVFCFYEDLWVVYPWEGCDKLSGPEDSVLRLIEFVGANPNSEGLKDTPRRVIRVLEEMCAGYKVDPSNILKTFEDGSCDEMIVLKDIDFCSICEHHLLPFFGKVHVGYIPNGKVVGVSKIARVVDTYARRLQIQERLTSQVANFLMEKLSPKGVMVSCEADHLCMKIRGVKKQNSTMITSAVRGSFKDQKEVRDEFLRLIRG